MTIMIVQHKYFNRDLSWLSFNYRVLLEAEDESLPIYERIKFLSIHASNLEEFYKVRVSEYWGTILKKSFSEGNAEDAEEILKQINAEAARQQTESIRILENQLIPELRKNNIILYQDEKIEPFHQPFINEYFDEEIFPYLEPVMLMKDQIRTFIRDHRIYFLIRMVKDGYFHYASMKIPFQKVPRFIQLPDYNGYHYIIFVDDIILANLQNMFPGFMIESVHAIRISRDADIYIEENKISDIAETIIQKVKKRKIGDLNRFVYDSKMPPDMLDYVCDVFNIRKEELIIGGKYMSLEDLINLPNPVSKELTSQPLAPLTIPAFEKREKMLTTIQKQDVLLHAPYQSFDYFIRFMEEAAFDPEVKEIKVTQYRVAEKSSVIKALIQAAQRGKKVTVFVELKARFDEENNWNNAEFMKLAGVRIIYSLPGLKVHAKIALVIKNKADAFAYLSTGNFNEKTARIYSDLGLFTANKSILKDVRQVFDVLEENKTQNNFLHMLVAQFNLLPTLKLMIEREIEHVKSGKKGYIILKMNGIQDEAMISELYKASEAGVEIDLIIRGICCVIPDQPYSRNIRITRIVDMFLEHSRIWYFYNDGQQDLYLTSADWLKRNLHRRIETAFPILDPVIKQDIIHLLGIQLQDNVKACRIDENLNNVKKTNGSPILFRSQTETYRYLQR